VRAVSREVKASDLAAWLSKDMGSGGGRRDKAGGYVSRVKYERRYGDQSARSYFTVNIKSYLEMFRVIDCWDPATLVHTELDTNVMKSYRKLPARLGYVLCHKLFEGRANLQIRMLEGDVDITASDETVLMIGIKGEVYPIELDKFIGSYKLTGEQFAPRVSYPPTVLNKNTGKRLPLLEFSNVCERSDASSVLAVQLKDHVKVFTLWDSESYLSGEPGDWLVANSHDDIYIITADVFEKLYIRDCTGKDVENMEGAVQVVKKTHKVSVAFALESGILETIEGPVAYERGDALLTGLAGESWPVGREFFSETYSPASPGIGHGQNGDYVKREILAWALQINEPFMVELTQQRGILQGKAGDWLLRYSADEYGIVRGDIFEATCSTIPSVQKL